MCSVTQAVCETVAVPRDLWGAFSETGGHRRCVPDQGRALRGRRPRSLRRWGEGFALPPGLRARRARGRALPWLLHPAGPGCGRQGAASGCRDSAGILPGSCRALRGWRRGRAGSGGPGVSVSGIPGLGVRSAAALKFSSNTLSI